jgi:hypothetical protein
MNDHSDIRKLFAVFFMAAQQDLSGNGMSNWDFHHQQNAELLKGKG